MESKKPDPNHFEPRLKLSESELAEKRKQGFVLLPWGKK